MVASYISFYQQIWIDCHRGCEDEVNSAVTSATYDYSSRYFRTELCKTSCIQCAVGAEGYDRYRCKSDKKKIYSWGQIYGEHDKERPRRYIVPSVSLDDVQDKNKRKLMIDIIYKTMVNQAAKEVWGDFKVQHSCLSKRHVVEQEKSVTDGQVISRLPVRFQGAARKWDTMQSRSFLADDIFYDKKNKRKNITYIKKYTYSSPL